MGRVFAITALFMLPGALMTLLVREPATAVQAPRPWTRPCGRHSGEFLSRAGIRGALLVLSFIFLYKLGDSLCTALATPFYLDMGFTKTEIGLVAKNAGLWPSVIGGLLGGLWMVRLGINRALWIFGFVQLVAIFGFAWLAALGPAPASPERLWILAGVIGRGPRSRLGNRRLRRLHRANHPPGLYGHPVCAVLSLGSGSPHRGQCLGGLVG